MTGSAPPSMEQRLLILAPTGRDAALCADVLGEAGVPCAICSDSESLRASLAEGAAGVLLAEEAIDRDLHRPLLEAVTHQPSWSDIPILLLTRRGADSATAAVALRTLGNVTLLERPTRVTAMVSAARSAQRARLRQYQMREHVETLRQSEERFRTLVSQVKDYAIFSADRHGRVTTWNEGCRSVLGYERDEFIGLDAAELFTPEDQRAGVPEAELREAERSGAANNDRWLMAKGGRRFFAMGITTALRGPSGELIGFSKVMRDQTDRKRAEETLSQSERRFRTMADGAPVMIWLADSNNRGIWFNRPWLDFTGRSLEQELGEGWLGGIHPEDAAECESTCRTAVAERREFRMRFRMRRRDGEWRWVLDHGVPLFTEAGPHRVFQGYVGSCVDITELEGARRVLEEREERLSELVASQTEQLKQTHERLRLSERMAALGTLSAGLGHDMGNLLFPVRVRLEALERSRLDPEQAEHVRVIRTSAEYLQRLSSGLRLLALDPARGAGQPSTEIHGWWAEASAVLKAALPAGIKFESAIESGQVCVAMSRPALTQAVFNLVQNAGEAMREGRRGTVRVAVQRRGNSVLVSVADDGPGMSPEVVARCMEPFFTTKTRGISTGLGLSLVFGLVRGAGGEVRIESEPGRGAKFTLELPAAAARQDKGPSATKLALVVVRSDHLRAFINHQLRTLSYQVTNDQAAEPRADLLVVDHAGAAGHSTKPGARILSLDSLAGSDNQGLPPVAVIGRSLRQVAGAAVGPQA